MSKAYDIVKAHYDASERGDLDGMMADFADNIRWSEMDGASTAGTFTGRDEIFQNVFMPIGRDWDGFGVNLERLIDGGDDIVALGWYEAKHKKTGKLLKARMAHVWTVEGDKIVRFQQFADTKVLDDAEH